MTVKVILVHGFMGDMKTTWEGFPELLNSDPNINCEIAQYGYSTSYWPLIGKDASIHNLAEGLLSEIKSRCDLENDEIILVGHSLGGLVIRKMLLNLHTKNLKHNIHKICFFAVPQDGSGLANLSSLIAVRNNKLKVLCKDSSYLEEMNDLWSYAKLNEQFDILSVVAGKDAVVNSNSAKSIFRDHPVETNIDAGHLDITKPNDSDDLSFILLRDFINKKRVVTKYKNKASLNYTEWRRHDRKHNLDFISDEKRLDDLNALVEALNSTKPIVRLTGLSGLGKSRLTIEYMHSQSIDEDEVLIFDASNYSDDIKKSLKLALKDNATGFVVIENCSVELHDFLTREVDAHDSPLKIISVNFYHDDVEKSVHVKINKLNSSAIKKLIKPILPQMREGDLDKIEKFVEGFPLLAVLIAERYRDDGVLSGDISDKGFVEKLINGDGALKDDERRVLEVCSLFDVFGVEDEGVIEADYIIKLAGSDRRVFGRVITKFNEREIVTRVGRFARVVPKPLAVQLAKTWWDENLYDTLTELIDSIPETLIKSFCDQITYLDTSEKLNQFVERLCDKCSPFGQAELLMTTKGSKLFRALVEVNPKATSESLYRVMNSLNDDEISQISGDVRRNFVWALEMLSFHTSYFEKSAWCLFKLASYENESYSNNSMGQFSQLFRWQLSGTEANFDQRLSVLNKALQLGNERSDMVVISAIKSAISSYGGTRTIGAEFQGTKPEMEEWRPKTWQEIFDYWKELFGVLLILAEKPYALELVKDSIGHEIRGLIGPGKIEMLDTAITSIIELNGKYWPSASQSIAHALEYDSKGMSQESLDALMRWQEYLSPDENNFKERLTLIVLDPSRDFEEDDDGQLIDMAEKDAIEFASKINSVDELIENIEYLLTFGMQKQSWSFGRELALTLDENESHILFSELIESLLSVEDKRFEFVSGYLSGIYFKNGNVWLDLVNVFNESNLLNKYYPDALRSGKCSLDQLMKYIDLIKEDALESFTATNFSYGRVLNHLTEDEIIKFCLELSQIDPQATWAALDVLNMYMFGRHDYDFDKLRPTLEKLLISVSFVKGEMIRHNDGYLWLKSVEKLLSNNGKDFVLPLTEMLVKQVSNNDIDYSILWDVFHPAFYKAFENYSEMIWPEFSSYILLDMETISHYRLRELFGSAREGRRSTNSIFTLIDENTVIDWCSNETALLIVVRSLKMFDLIDEVRTPNSLLIRLIDVYGHNQDFLSEVRVNFHTRSWVGSIVPGFEEDKEALSPLLNHESQNVRQWVTEFITMIDSDIKHNIKHESEQSFTRGM